MQKWETGSPKIPKEVYQTIRSAIQRSPMWVLSCVNGWQFTKVGQENVGYSTVNHVEICSPKGEILPTISVATHVRK